MSEESVNLWELITLCQHQLGYGRDAQAVWKNAAKGSRYHYQELRLSVDEAGWTITVFSCDSPGLTTIKIPRDRGVKPTVEEEPE